MAKKCKLTKNGETIYPCSTMDAIVHPTLKVPSSKLIGEINVSNLFPTGGTNGTNKYTLESAIAKIPTDLRVVGIKCSFLSDAGTVEEWVYQGGTFTSTNSWMQGGSGSGGNMILEWNTDVATTRKQAKQSVRKAGMQISYLDPDNGWINEQYVGTLFTDTEWAKDANWQQIVDYNLLFNSIAKEKEKYSIELQQINDYTEEDGSWGNPAFTASKTTSYIPVMFNDILEINSEKQQTGAYIEVYDNKKNRIESIDYWGANTVTENKILKINNVDSAYIRISHTKDLTLKKHTINSYYNYEENVINDFYLSAFVGTNGTVYGNSEYKSTGYFPVKLGDVITFATQKKFNNIPLAGFDENFGFVKDITPITYADKIEQETIIEDNSISYVVCSYFVGNTDNNVSYCYKNKEKSTKLIYESIKVQNGIYVNGSESFTIQLNGIIDNGDGVYELQEENGYWIFTPNKKGFSTSDKLIIACKIEYLSENTETVKIGAYATNLYDKELNPGEVYQGMWLGNSSEYWNNSIKVKTGKIGDKFRISLIYVFAINEFDEKKLNNFFLYRFAQRENFELEYIYRNSIFSFAVLNSFYGAKGVFFGDSRTTLYTEYLRDYFSMTGYTNLGYSGQVPKVIYSLERLQQIPSDANLIFMAGGINGGISEENLQDYDITSRDTNNPFGVLNTAIDYIRENNPLANIVLISPMLSFLSSRESYARLWSQVYNLIADYRCCIFCDLTNRLNIHESNVMVYTDDGLHPNAKGHRRIANFIRAQLNAISY